jgi:phage terminase large subunit-like protein
MNSTPSSPTSAGNLQSALSTLEAEKNRRLTTDRLKYYKPFPRQAEFHAAGATHRERLLMAGNQTGKTWATCMELAFHVTGDYPSWWCGHRFDHAIRALGLRRDNEVVRETLQLLLLGPPGQYGTGCIPKASLIDVTPARGLADLVDTIRVQHVGGDVSTIQLKAYSQGRERFQGATIDYALVDEEPDFPFF